MTTPIPADRTADALVDSPRSTSSQAFGLPAGSIRALLALIVFGGIWAWMWLKPDVEVPPYLRDLMFIIMGHYFAARAKQRSEPLAGPPPLWLPKGTIRGLLVIGFLIVGGLLFYQGRMTTADKGGIRLNHAAVTLILVGGFLLGVVISQLTHSRRVPRWIEDLRAAVSLAAAVLLLLMLFGIWRMPDAAIFDTMQRFFAKYRAEEVMAALVGFYFGSKS